LFDEADDKVRAALRLGAYQLHFMDIPTFAAVDATVGAVPKRIRGLLNAVLRKVAQLTPEWPSEAMRLSYPDWIFDRLTVDMGADDALAAMEAMNSPARTSVRADGYVQDPASQDVVRLVAARQGELIIDVCAAPGGKATGIAADGARVIAGDVRRSRARLITTNAVRTSTTVATVVADGCTFPVRPGSADAVLVDAPCSGLGSLRRRPDARWRIDEEAPERMAALQRRLLRSAAGLVRPGGRIIYSVCTMTSVETVDVVAALGWEPDGPPIARIPSRDSDGMWSQVLRCGSSADG
jgi:16S rRNA (cytosine967-C5)-methyltransferase